MQLEAALERQRELMRFQLKDEKYGDEMKNAKGLLRTFRSNDQRERLYLALALATFLGVVAYIVWRRLGSRIAALVGTFL